ncbi:MAG: translation initiation factor IF-2 [Bacillota bacterium]|jgi:translation initiation factor IF-2
MSKIRIYELARELNVPSKKLVEALADLDLNVQNHMSTIDNEVADIIRQVLRPAEKTAARQPEKVAAEVPKEQPRKQDPPQEARKGKDVSAEKSQPKENEAKPVIARQPSSKQQPRESSVEQPAEPAALEELDDLEEFDLPDEEQTKPKRSSARRGDDRQRSRGRRSSNRRARGRQQTATESKPEPRVVKLDAADITVGELATKLKRPANEVIRKLIELGVMAAINQTIDVDTATLVANELGFEVQQAAPPAPVYDSPFEIPVEPDDPADLKLRPPVVTVMGHVDHGKTSLLDAIRQSNVTATEAGGITQHIGAYQVKIMDQLITFLDTPGHEAFTAMRARGAQATDIAVLVVAADDGIMPQTVEAINHSKAAGVPIIVAINKIDRPAANPDRVKQQLTEHGLIPEEWGGDTMCVNVSALKRTGIDDLLTAILTLAEVAELKANPNKPARGVVIESKVDRGRGPVATVLIHSGTLNVGDVVLAGASQGRIRAMNNHQGRRIQSAGPSTPVEIIGLSDVAEAGEPFMVLADEKEARQYAEKLREKKREEELKSVQRVSLDDLFSQIQQGEVKDLNIIVKADVQGSIEALRQSLIKLSTDEVEVKVIHEGVGPVNESDILLATASQAIIVGFNVRPDPATRKLAEQQNVDIRLYRVIYDAIEDVENAIKGMLAPVFREAVLGQAEVRQIFKASRIGTIAGSYVTDGKITRQAQVRLIRDGVVIYEGRLDSLKRFKDDVREVLAGYECGITLENFNDIKEGDIIEAFSMEEVKAE